jgi:hypothetical protein
MVRNCLLNRKWVGTASGTKKQASEQLFPACMTPVSEACNLCASCNSFSIFAFSTCAFSARIFAISRLFAASEMSLWTIPSRVFKEFFSLHNSVTFDCSSLFRSKLCRKSFLSSSNFVFNSLCAFSSFKSFLKSENVSKTIKKCSEDNFE